MTFFKKNFVDNFITPNPTEDDAIREARLYNARTGFPTMIFGAIDGTHIKVKESQFKKVAKKINFSDIDQSAALIQLHSQSKAPGRGI